VERWARERAGRAPLAEGGFIEHYLTGVVYPEPVLGAAQLLVAALVLLSWARLATGRGPVPTPDRRRRT
jgi:hypothetical protein